ncbi:NTP transferase domain-containing protein [Citricoccus sp. GCM10030269]|uniref:NTP transferase domain-containing protein n=1 Tax=Citricoccus sp. GCM10030269 TaxID=3273388 RepID=UPI0036145B5E
MTPDRLAAVVLAGGASSRMGRDKASLELDGSTLLDRTVRAAVGAGATRVVVVGDRPDRPVAPADAEVLFVREDPPGSGPVAALDTALAHVEADWLLVLPCDLARPGEACRELLRAADIAGCEDSRSEDGAREDDRDPLDGVVAVDAAGRRQHLTAVFRTAPLRRAATAGVTRVRERVAGLNLREVSEPADRPGLWDDMDTPEDLERVRAESTPAVSSPEAPQEAPRETPQETPQERGTMAEQEIPGLRVWLETVATELDLPESVVVPGPLLDVARDVARGVVRPGAPTTTYLVGVAVGLQLAGESWSDEAVASLIDRVSSRIQDLALDYDPSPNETSPEKSSTEQERP